jgi:microsomal dipeptidase-like Zn-dependent dipeptidase
VASPRLAGRTVAGILAGLVLAAFASGPGLVERRLNPLLPPPSAAPSAAATALHRKLFVADLHADSLLWGRDLLRRAGRGHVDLPRLVDGGVALQAFTVVTKTPSGLNIERNDDRSDDITRLALLQRWPLRTWGSLKERALYQAQRLHRAAARADGALTVIETARDLEELGRRRETRPGAVGAILGLEGAHALEGDPANVDVLYAAGFRMIAPAHFFDTEMGGSAHGVEKGGLTAKGREMVQRMEGRGILVDLAHASADTFRDVVALATRPVVVSHTGVRGTCANQRNLDDDQLRGVAGTRGVVGIGVWEAAVCGTDAGAMARAIRHAVNVAGVDHVGLGSDFDGAVTAPFDATGWVFLTDALLRSGLGEDEVGKVMGGNVLRVLGLALPR